MKRVFLIIIIFLFATNCTTNDEIKIGAILPLTGNAAQWGVPAQNGIQIAFDEINSNGGINGKKINIIFEDSQCQAQTGNSAINKLLTADNPIAIIGAVCSSVTLAIAPSAERSQTPLISPASTNPDISNAGDYIFRVIPSDALRGQVFAQHVYENGYENVAILFINNDGGSGNEQTFRSNFEDLGGNIVLTEAYSEDASDVRTQLLRIREANPDAMVIVSYVEDTVTVLRNVRELGIEIPLFFQTEALDDPSVISNAGDAANGATYITYAEVDNQAAAKFDSLYQKSFNRQPELFAAEAYDAVNIISMILKESTNLNSQELKDELYNIRNYQGASGELSFDSSGDVIKPLAIKKIVQSEQEILRVY